MAENKPEDKDMKTMSDIVKILDSCEEEARLRILKILNYWYEVWSDKDSNG